MSLNQQFDPPHQQISFNEHNAITSHLRHQNSNSVKFIVSSTRSGGKFESLFHHNNSYWHSNFEPNSWLCIDFSSRKVCASDYLLRSATQNRPKSWILEGSNNKSDWTIIDRQVDQKCFLSSLSEDIFHYESNKFFSEIHSNCKKL
jgi:hypothetical protein